MKKVMTLMAVITLSVSTIAEAKRGVGFKSTPTRNTPAVQKKNTQQTQQQKAQQQNQQKADADFNNTPKQTPPSQPNAQTAQNNRLANFATGAMAGYLLSDMLSPNEAQAQENNEQQSLQQLTEQVKNVASQVPAFKSIDPADPFLIEKTQGYLRYCLNGVQYLISTANTQLPPTLMVDRTNSPAQCVINP